MSTPTSESTNNSQFKRWWPAALVVVIVACVVAAAVAMTPDDPGGPPDIPLPPYGSVGDPKAKQADWKFSIRRGGKPGKLTKSQKKVFQRQRKVLRSVARDVYDSMFLSPEQLDRAMKKQFSPQARRAMKRTDAGLPKRARDVRIHRRIARIVIDTAGNARATMEVRLVASGSAKDKKFALEHRSSLYMTRESHQWRVFGFSVDQKPHEKQAKRGDGKKGSKGSDDSRKEGSHTNDKKSNDKKSSDKKSSNKKSSNKKGGRS